MVTEGTPMPVTPPNPPKVRVFIADGREFPDPDPNMPIADFQKQLADFMPELHNAEVKETDKYGKHYVQFIKKVGTKGRINPDEILDELCECGHLKSKHKPFLTPGHGSCTQCDCRQFTWKEFVFKTDARK